MLLSEALQENLAPPLQESVLREISKSLGSFVFGDKLASSASDSFIDVLFETAGHTNINSSHRTAAINVLCGYLLQLSSPSPAGGLATLSLPKCVCRRLLQLYLDLYDGAKQKSMEQLLNSLIKLLARTTDTGIDCATDDCISRLFSVLFEGHDRVRAKCSFHAMTLFLSRGLTTTTKMVRLYGEGRAFAHNRSPFQDILYHTFEWVRFSDVAPGAGQFAALLVKAVVTAIGAKEGPGSSSWAVPLLNSLSLHVNELSEFKNSVFPGLFCLDAQQYWDFLTLLHAGRYFSIPQSDGERLAKSARLDENFQQATLFSALEVGKECGILIEHDDSSSWDLQLFNGSVLLKAAALEELLGHASAEARLSGLTVLVLSKQSTKPYSTRTLKALRQHLPHLHADTDAHFRGEVVSLSRRLILRLKSILSSLTKGTSQRFSSGNKTTSTPSAARTTSQESIECHLSFLRWYASFLGHQLHPSASYQRHTTALKVLKNILFSGLDGSLRNLRGVPVAMRADVVWPVQVQVLTDISVRNLLDLLLDPFDDVRAGALEILKLLDDRPDHQSLDRAVTRARFLLKQSGRVDYADGFARLTDLQLHRSMRSAMPTALGDASAVTEGFSQQMYMNNLHEMLASLEEAVEVAQSSIMAAVEDYPMHGLLVAFRYAIEELSRSSPDQLPAGDVLEHLREKLTHTVVRIWECTKTILCNDAPEGFEPDDLEEDSALTTKDVSSYAWRSVKESSHLLRTICISEFLYPGLKAHVDKGPQLKVAGNLCFAQLAALRHRGAFSTVAQTFAIVCSNCTTSSDVETRGMLVTWYKVAVDTPNDQLCPDSDRRLQGALELMHEKASTTTRRSAGIPALVVGICNAEPPQSLFDEMVGSLKDIATQPVPPSIAGRPPMHLPQVHAMNTLKLLFAQPKLVERLEPYLVAVLHIAARNLPSEIWAIRNASLILFRGLIDRLLGSNEKMETTRSTQLGNVSRLTYSRYPGLLNLMKGTLEYSRSMHLAKGIHSKSESARIEAVFPVLDLLRKAPPPTSERQSFETLILDAVDSNHWHVRELAAQAYAALASGADFARSTGILLSATGKTQNELHGRVLCLKALVEALPQTDRTQYRKQLMDTYHTLVAHAHSVFTNANGDVVWGSYVDCLNTTQKLLIPMGQPDVADRDLMRAWEEDTVIVHRALEDKPGRDALLRRSMMLNKWLTCLATASLMHLDCEGHGAQHKIDEIISCDFHDRETIVQVIQELLRILAPAALGVRTYFMDVLAQYALHNPEMQLACRSAFCDMLASAGGFADLKLQSATMMRFLPSRNDVEQIETGLCPSEAQQLLVTWGFSLGLQLQRTRFDAPSGFDSWMRVIRSSTTEANETSLRRSAVEAILAFVSCCDVKETTSSYAQENLALALYDLLNDDDPHIRDIAAYAASKITGNRLANKGDNCKVPLVAAQELISMLLEDHATSLNLMRQAIFRLTGQNTNGVRNLCPVGSILRAQLQQQSRLFEEEKQNLYRNDVREAAAWASLLMRLPLPDPMVPLIDDFVTWVLEGVDEIASHTAVEFDSALGWTSKEATFTLGLQVLSGAAVTIAWECQTSTFSEESSRLRRSLQTLADAGKQQKLHPFWMSMVDDMLSVLLKEDLKPADVMLQQLQLLTELA